MAASFGHVAVGCLTVGCPSSAEQRERFGCDATSDQGYAIECWACHGKDPDCSICSDDGGVRGIWFHRCPRSVVSHETLRVVQAAMESVDGILPVPGGMLDQSAQFVRARRFTVPLVRHHESIEIRRKR